VFDSYNNNNITVIRNLVHERTVQDAELLSTVARLVSTAHQVVDDLADVEQRVSVTDWNMLNTKRQHCKAVISP